MDRILPENMLKLFDYVLNGKDLPRGLRTDLLGVLAMNSLETLFPEGIERAAREVRLERWHRLHNELSTNPNRDKIFRVLESPLNGERFDWLE